MATAIDPTSGDLMRLGTRHQIKDVKAPAPGNTASLVAPLLVGLAYITRAILASSTGVMLFREHPPQGLTCIRSSQALSFLQTW